jgi:ATP citrate (pro-S)-lyase
MASFGDTPLVAKPDQLIKRRGNSGLLKLNASQNDIIEWLKEKLNSPIETEGISDTFHNAIVEAFIPHESHEEFYVAMQTRENNDEILFYKDGGVDVGDVDSKASRIQIKLDETNPDFSSLLDGVSEGDASIISEFITHLYEFFKQSNAAYLEINPFVLKEGKIYSLDFALKLDDTASFVASDIWGEIDFPPPFGRSLSEEEALVEDLDSKTGASLKLTILNPSGRLWTLVAGGGASVVYADTVVDLGGGNELANYGEYSGNPNAESTYQYTKTVLDLMTREAHPDGKALIVGGGVANFTDVAKTFTGIIRAIKEYRDKLHENNVKIYVRRGGPNYAEGLQMMKNLGIETGLPIEVYGPETHMTHIVRLAIDSIGGAR